MSNELKFPYPSHVMLIYAAGGIGKSTRAEELAEYVKETLGMRTRVVSADGGGTSKAIRFGIEEGFVDFWPIDLWTESSPFSLLELASKGYWPVDHNIPNSPLRQCVINVRPCPWCDKDTGAKGLAMVKSCGTCKKELPPGTVPGIRREPINGMETVGAVVFEGLTSFGEILLRRLKTINPDGGRFIEDKVGDGESFKIAGLGKQHYGDAQNYLAQYVSNCRKIPTWCVMWTALESRGTGEDGSPLYGPKGPGKALTSACIPWFTDVIHLDGLPKPGKMAGIPEKDSSGNAVIQRKFFLGPHYPSDAPQHRFEAKTSVTGMPLSMEPSLKRYFKRLEEAYQEQKTKGALNLNE